MVFAVEVTELGDGAVQGQSYTLRCVLPCIQLLENHSPSYAWTNGSSSRTLGRSMMYSFTPGPRDDGVVYTCAVTVNSNQLRDSIVMTGSLTLRVLCK